MGICSLPPRAGFPQRTLPHPWPPRPRICPRAAGTLTAPAEPMGTTCPGSDPTRSPAPLGIWRGSISLSPPFCWHPNPCFCRHPRPCPPVRSHGRFRGGEGVGCTPSAQAMGKLRHRSNVVSPATPEPPGPHSLRWSPSSAGAGGDRKGPSAPPCAVWGWRVYLCRLRQCWDTAGQWARGSLLCPSCCPLPSQAGLGIQQLSGAQQGALSTLPGLGGLG